MSGRHLCTICNENQCFGKQCKICHLKMIETYYMDCPICEEKFRHKTEDGRTFDKCLSCFSKKIQKCQDCNKNTIPEKFLRCVECKEKFRKLPPYEGAELKDCSNKVCKNTTYYSECSSCFKVRRDLESQYLISTCSVMDCNYRGKGNFKFCPSHKKKN